MTAGRVIDLFFTAAGFGPPDLRVTAFNGREAVSELFQYDIDLIHENQSLEPDQFLGQDGSLEIRGPDGERFATGIISRFEYTGRAPRWAHYRARIVPKLWLLRHRTRCKIFQGKTTPQILDDVLTGITTEPTWTNPGAFPVREYCVQYRESDFDFASRMMEEEGIYYFFKHTADGHTMVLSNAPAEHPDLPDDATLPYREPGTGVAGHEQVMVWRQYGRIRPGKIMLRDFDFKKPTLDLGANKANGDGELELYDYPGRYEKVADGNRFAEIRLEERRSVLNMATGESNCGRLIPGFKFALEEHPNGTFNHPWFVLRLDQSGEQPQAAEEDAGSGAEESVYHNSFDCIPADHPYRPERLTPHPRVEGPQTAIVTGPSGEEIHTDEYGRVKVQFHWDREGARDDKSSCWIRIAHGWAHAGWGMITIPRIGMEVVVEFLEGDPDRPIVTGCVYNGANPPPYGLPAEKTKSTLKSNTSPGGGSYNEIRLEDTGGAQEMFVNASKDMNIVVANNRTRNIGNDETIDITRDRKKKIGRDQELEVVRDQKAKIGKDDSLEVVANQSIKIGGNEQIEITGSLGEQVGGNASINIDGTLGLTVGKQATVTIGQALTEKVGADLTTDVTGKRSLTVAGTNTESITGAESIDVGGAQSTTVGGAYSLSVKGTSTWESTGNLTIKAPEITIEAESKIVLKAGGAEIELSGDNIKAKGSKIEQTAEGDYIIKGATVKSN